MKKLSLSLVMLLCAICTFAIPAANVTITHPLSDNNGDNVTLPFGTYYSAHTANLDGKNGQSLELALTSIIYTHSKQGYDNLWELFKITDPGPLDSIPAGETLTDLVYDMYSWMAFRPHFYSENDHMQSSSRGINREHAVPNSWWGGESRNNIAYTDLHHLVPSDGAANNKKSNHPLGCGHDDKGSNPTHTTNSASFLWSVAASSEGLGGGSNYVWEPVDEYKGDFARMYLYVVCAYEGNITWETNYMFTSDAACLTTIKPWAKELLLDWHRQDPVSNKELARNNAVYGIQGNRNPFIDYPELVEYIWGNKSTQTFSLANAVSAYDPDYSGEPKEGLYFPHIAKLGQHFTPPAFTTDSDGALTWKSSNPAVATVDNEGHVVIHAVGTTIITVTQAETDTHKQGSASYMIKVIE